MPSQEFSGGRSLPRIGSALGIGCLILALGGCAGTSQSGPRPPGAQRVVSPTCSLRAVANIRQGSSIRSDADLVDIARRLSVNLSVLQTMGRNSKMIVIRENGPQELCEDSLATLRNDLRFESIEQY
jgi:hypothetical protein